MKKWKKNGSLSYQKSQVDNVFYVIKYERLSLDVQSFIIFYSVTKWQWSGLQSRNTWGSHNISYFAIILKHIQGVSQNLMKLSMNIDQYQ